MLNTKKIGQSRQLVKKALLLIKMNLELEMDKKQKELKNKLVW